MDGNNSIHIHVIVDCSDARTICWQEKRPDGTAGEMGYGVALYALHAVKDLKEAIRRDGRTAEVSLMLVIDAKKIIVDADAFFMNTEENIRKLSGQWEGRGGESRLIECLCSVFDNPEFDTDGRWLRHDASPTDNDVLLVISGSSLVPCAHFNLLDPAWMPRVSIMFLPERFLAPPFRDDSAAKVNLQLAYIENAFRSYRFSDLGASFYYHSAKEFCSSGASPRDSAALLSKKIKDMLDDMTV